MRNAFLKAITDLAQYDKDLILLTADLGFSVFESFEECFPGQFVNVGIAEQAMIGIASGLAKEGKKVVVYSIGNFPTFRCLEQIRNDACYHNLNINIIGMGGGYSYGALGMSHHATEDVSVMCALPNVRVMAPTGASEAYELVKQSICQQGVGYVRLEKLGYDSSVGDVVIGQPRIIKHGKEVIVFAIGGILTEVMKACSQANSQGVFPTIVSMHTVKPFDSSSMKLLIRDYSLVVTVEENNLFGGLGSIVGSLILSSDLNVRLRTIGIKDKYESVVGNQAYLRQKANISSGDILSAIIKPL